MNYGQFLNMIPEATLVAILIILFIADFALSNNEKKLPILRYLGISLMALQIIPCMMTGPSTAFDGLYFTTGAVSAMKVILTGGTAVVLIMAQPWLEKNKLYAGEFYMLVVSTLLGMYTMMSSGHFLMFFLGLEMASVPMACLVAMDKWKKESAEAGAKYIITATFSSAIMLYGISFIYGATGTLYFNDVAAQLTTSTMTIAGLVFFFSGLGFKLSLVPFHFWTADTYQGAPTVHYWQYLLFIVIVLSITVANLFAIRQHELKRFMAFSSISQAGYIMLAVVGNSAMGVTALMFYTLVYVVANLAVFAVINVIEQKNGGVTEMDAYNGLYETNPKLSFLMTLALFSLAGIPPFAGMFSKFFVFMAAVNGHTLDNPVGVWAYVVVFIALINTVVSLYYYLLIVKAMYIKKSDKPIPAFESDDSTKLALAICTAGVVLFGICSCVYSWLSSSSIGALL